MGIGLFLKKYFKNKEVELFVDHQIEWIEYAESTTINNMVICGIFHNYDSDSGIITVKSKSDEQVFYIDETFVKMFWAPGFRLFENSRSLINTGQKAFKIANKKIKGH